ncbi:MAG TPA: hypothetical protein VFH27_09830, partial [Longimicrobiaceae bacterium]|nr:hypothetical protein [Longimicrobiaceae bacterium]
LPERAHGWPLIVEGTHMSCCSGYSDLYRFDGRRYRWRSVEARVYGEWVEDSVVYRVALTPTRAETPRRLVLNPVNAGGGLRVSARYDLCRRGRRVPCGQPVLRLMSARLPAGRVCVTLHTVNENRRYDSAPGNRWCGVTVPAARLHGGTERLLELRPSPRDWMAVSYGRVVELRGPGLPGELSMDSQVALDVFVSHLKEVYALPDWPWWHGPPVSRR